MKKNAENSVERSIFIIKFLKIMRISTLFIMFSFLNIYAEGHSQNEKLTIQNESISLRQLFSIIEKESHYKFLYNDDYVNFDKTVSLHANQQPINEILSEVFDKSNIGFKLLENNLIVIMPKDLLQQKKITGTVTDATTGESLPGVSVMIEGTKKGTVTGVDGKFMIEISNANAVLVFSFIGYLTEKVPLSGKSVIDVKLKADVKKLDEVVVVGYGVQKKGNLTGSVSSTKSSELTIAPMASTTNSLVGRLPGLVSIQTSGLPGSDAANLSIRGFGNALVIVDGVESTFDDIDVNQIESISILKDGSASIYGARAGNGVILVTTKRGQDQKPTITLNSSYTLQGVTKMIHPASSGQRTQMERETYLQSGQPEANAPWTADAVAKYFAGNDPAYPNTDWFDYVFRSWAPEQNHNLSIRGGSEKIKYYGFLGYTDQETMIKRNGGNYNRYNAQSNIDATITKNLSMTIDVSMAFENRLFPVRGLQNGGYLWQDYYATKPWYPSTLPDPTKVAWGGIDVGSIATTSNMDLMGYNLSKGSDIRGTISLNYNFEGIKGLKAKALVNYLNNETYGKSFNKPISFYTYNPNNQTYAVAASFTQSGLSESMNRGNVLTQQYSLNYDNVFNKIHRVSFLALFESTDYHNNNFNASRINLLTPAIDQLFIGSTTGMGNNGSASEMGRISYVSRLNYSLMDRYLLESTLRADASAKFPSNNRWGYFPSISLGWVISQERFMKSIKALDNLKLRTSYGQSGNDAVGNFQYLSGYSVLGNSILDNTAQPGIYATGLANPLLTWEKMTIYNGGLDFSFLNRKIYGTGDIFYRMRTGIPATRITSLPSTFGATLPPENLNSMDNRGFELILGTSNTVGNFTYDISGNISWSRSKWIHYEEPVYTDPDQKRIYQLSEQWTDRVMGYVSNGLFTSQDQINALKYTYTTLNGNSSLRPGDVIYKDLNGDGKLDWKDQTDIGKGTTPHWIYGFNYSVKYKNFDLTGLFQGAFGYNTLVNLTMYPNATEYDLRWTEQNNNPNALVPRLGGASTNGYTSDYNYKSTSYIRLKTASLGYDFPKRMLEKIGISKLRVYFAGTNLFTLSTLNKYGMDPEIPSGTIMYYPQQRTFSLGLNVSF
jgi:TonB-linked SusC/RagA family outer membrane protein